MYSDLKLQHISLDDMMNRIKDCLENEFDLVVAVGRGGVLPGYLASRYLGVPLEIIDVRYRDDTHTPMYPEPRAQKPLGFDPSGKRVLLTDDVSNSGATLRKASELLEGGKITTLVISGKGDFSLYGPHNRCIRWPWEDETGTA
ncbi:MAG TPA: phosphoribosyltransferase [Spirochaetia bacterium]|nr:phosphoribosyltransferase [Spirochaetia bacterium]